jgi:hypothetical protein
MSRLERQNKRRLQSIEDFFMDKQPWKKLVSTFESYKAQTKENNVYILDELTDTQKELFHKYYGCYFGGSGTMYSNKYCNDQEYRSEYRFPRVDESTNLVLIK